MSEERSPWRMVLSVCITIFFVIRLLYTCSKMGNSTNTYNQNNAIESLENNQMMNEYRRVQAENMQKNSNQFMYKPYKEIDSIQDQIKKIYSVRKLKNDSVVDLDIETKIKIAKESFFQKNYDDSLKMAFKSLDDISVFIHDFSGTGSNEYNLKSIKRGLNLQELKTEKGVTKNCGMLSYTVTKDGTLFNGYALAFKNEDYNLFLEFESAKASPKELKLKALTFLLTNLKASKKN